MNSVNTLMLNDERRRSLSCFAASEAVTVYSGQLNAAVVSTCSPLPENFIMYHSSCKIKLF